MKEKVLLPLDGSAVGEAAIPVVVDVISRLNAANLEITLLQVISAFAYSALSESVNTEFPVDGDELNAFKEKSNSYLEKVATRIRNRGLTVNTMVTVGHAADEILRVSQDLGVRIIAMSTHGRSGIGRFALGSVTDKVLQHSPVPVLVVRAKVSK